MLQHLKKIKNMTYFFQNGMKSQIKNYMFCLDGFTKILSKAYFDFIFSKP
jgi:hypothetical protein